MMTPEKYYIRLKADAEDRRKGLNNKILAISALRLTLVVAMVVAVWGFWGAPAVMGAVEALCIVTFLSLVKYHDKLFRLRGMEEAYIKIADDNMARLRLDLKKASAGEEYIDAGHGYSYDLDVFGKESLFSLLDTTATRGGRDLLAKHLQEPELVRDEIAARQGAIGELEAKVDFRTELRALGMVRSAEERKVRKAMEVDDMPSFALSLPIRMMMWAVPVAWLVIIGLGIAGMAVGVPSTILVMLSFLIAASGAKRVGRLHDVLNEITEKVLIYQPLFEEIGQTAFESEKLREISEAVGGEQGAGVATRRLLGIVSNLDQRYNWLSYLLFNVLVQWDYRQIAAAGRWMKRYGVRLAEWEASLSQIDELSAIATFGYNNPNYVFAKEDASGEVVMAGKAMGHPLLGKDKCVCNGVKVMRGGDFMVVTGANMAGKSTYLRMVGVNYLFALIGAPVFADEMTFSPRRLCTGLRTTDSLQENKSYFFAELTRLQGIIQRADAGERLFVILDEILKGTNSVDKQKGSIGLVRQLVNKQVTGIIATHDLKLGMLADEFPGKVDNYCFEAQIGGDSLTFDYKLQKGVAQNMNATYLMRKMGIIE